MGAAARIAAKDLKLRLRDRSVFITAILAPLVLAFIFDVVFGSAFESGSGLGLEYGVVDLDGSEISGSFTGVLRDLEQDGVLTLTVLGDPASAETAVENGQLDAFFLIPAGLGEAVTTQRPAEIRVVGDIDAPTSTQIAASIANQFALGVDTAQLAVVTTAELASSPLTPEFFASLSHDPATAAFTFELADVSAATRQLDATTYFAAGMVVFFLFFTVQFGVLGLLQEGREGTLARLLAAPIRRSSVVVGKAILAFAVGVMATVVLVVATSLIMGADWGPPLGVALLVVAGALSAVGVMGLVASAAKTPEGAGNLGAIIAVILGLLGGTFFPVGQGNDLLSRLTYLTPHAWFIRGLGELAGGAPWTAALPAAGAMLVFAVVTGLVAWALLRRRLAT